VFTRQLTTNIQHVSHKKKAIIVLGPRQVGKTTLIKFLLGSDAYLFLNGDDQAISKQLSEADTFKIKQIIGSHTKVFVDEAQKIGNIGKA
jgi:predicted AAA+ superfamily ATPase